MTIARGCPSGGGPQQLAGIGGPWNVPTLVRPRTRPEQASERVALGGSRTLISRPGGRRIRGRRDAPENLGVAHADIVAVATVAPRRRADGLTTEMSPKHLPDGNLAKDKSSRATGDCGDARDAWRYVPLVVAHTRTAPVGACIWVTTAANVSARTDLVLAPARLSVRSGCGRRRVQAATERRMRRPDARPVLRRRQPRSLCGRVRWPRGSPSRHRRRGWDTTRATSCD
jgi:hypothetical protein